MGLLFSAGSVGAADIVEGKEPSSWSSCQTATDCVVVGSPCPNFYWAINRQFVFANAARNAAERGALDCAVSFQSRPDHAFCEQGQCQIPHNQTATTQLEQH